MAPQRGNPNPGTSHPSFRECHGRDHGRWDQGFERFRRLKPDDLAVAACAFEVFRVGLECHLAWPEDIRFPLLEGQTGMTSGPTEVRRWEPQQIRACLRAIGDRLAAEGEDRSGEEAGLLTVFRPPNQKEESILHPMMNQLAAAGGLNPSDAAMEQHP